MNERDKHSNNDLLIVVKSITGRIINIYKEPDGNVLTIIPILVRKDASWENLETAVETLVSLGLHPKEIYSHEGSLRVIVPKDTDAKLLNAVKLLPQIGAFLHVEFVQETEGNE